MGPAVSLSPLPPFVAPPRWRTRRGATAPGGSVDARFVPPGPCPRSTRSSPGSRRFRPASGRPDSRGRAATGAGEPHPHGLGGDDRWQPPAGARLQRRLAGGLRGDAPRVRCRTTMSGRPTFSVPAGDWEYKAPLNDAWDENYGLHAAPGGANIPLSLGADRRRQVLLRPRLHWVTDNVGSVIAVAPGSFQSELGAPATGIPAAFARGSRTSTVMERTRSRRPRCPPARTRRRSRSTRRGTRTMARAASPAARTSRSPSRPTTPR